MNPPPGKDTDGLLTRLAAVSFTFTLAMTLIKSTRIR